MRSIPSIGPSITRKEVRLVKKAVKHGWYENRNIYLEKFCYEIMNHTNKQFSIPTSHGTSAIHLALLSLGIGPGDEVIVPDISWVASATPILYVGAKPVFVDIEEDYWCISPASVEKAISDNTKAIIVVNLFGNMANYNWLKEISNKYSIPLIEDAAESIGATYNSKNAGSFGDISIFSFNATKLVMAGQGGILLTDNEEIYTKAKLFQHHGINKEKNARYYWSTVLGYNYNWTNIQAALALAQFSRLENFINKRKKIYNWYCEGLQNIDGITLNQERKNSSSSFWVITIIVDESYKKPKEYIEEKLKDYRIDARPFFYPMSSMPPFKTYVNTSTVMKKNSVAYNISPFGISLPSGHNLKKREVKYVCKSIKEILSK